MDQRNRDSRDSTFGHGIHFDLGGERSCRGTELCQWKHPLDLLDRHESAACRNQAGVEAASVFDQSSRKKRIEIRRLYAWRRGVQTAIALRTDSAAAMADTFTPHRRTGKKSSLRDCQATSQPTASTTCTRRKRIASTGQLVSVERLVLAGWNTRRFRG